MRAAIIAALLLAACAKTPPPAVEVRVQRVEIPVVVACVKAADIPAEPPRIGAALNGDAEHDASLIAASALRLRAALESTLALLTGCTITGNH